MKPSSLPEACSIKSKKHNKLRFQPLLAHFSFPLGDAATIQIGCKDTKQHSCEKQQARTSLQPCFHAWPFFILYIPRRRFNYRAAQGQVNELVTCQNNQLYSDLWTIAGMRSAEGQEKGCPTNSSLLFNSGKNTQKPALNSVTQSVFLCYSGAQRSHDKNKLCDKNTARAKRCGHGEGISMQ